VTDVVVNGVPVKSLGYVGDLTWSHTWPGGCAEASWSMAGLAKSVASATLKRGARVKVVVGGFPVWQGVLDQPGAAMEDFAARGLSREAERYLAVDGSGAATFSPDTAITTAVGNGLPWIYDGGTAPAGVPNDSPEYLSQLLDVSATAASQRWGVGADGRFFSAADPTAPSLHAIPGVGVMGQADDEYATHLFGRYVSAMSGTPPVPSAWAVATVSDDTAAALYGRSDQFVDLTPRGLLTSAQAGSIIAGMLAQGRARVGFTERLELADYQLLRNGSPAALPFVKAGEMVRVHGAISPGQSATGSNFMDFIIGETSYTAGSRSITLAPVGLAPRTLSDVLAVTAVAESVA